MAFAEAIRNKNPAVTATVIEVRDASPAKVGAQIVLLAEGSTTGTAGGGKLEAAILSDAKAALADGQPCLAESGEDAVGTLLESGGDHRRAARE